MIKSIVQDAELVVLTTGLSAGTTDHVFSPRIDMSDASKITAVLHLGSVTAAGTARLIPGYSTSTGGAVKYFTDGIAGSTDATGYTDLLLVSEVVDPKGRYMAFKVDRGAQNVSILSGLVLKYGVKTAPVTQSTAYVADSDITVCPTTT